MVARVLLLRVLPVLIAVLATSVTVVVAGTPAPPPPGSERLPDLDQAVPKDVVITLASVRGRTVHRLGFSSAVSNVGEGPLIIQAHRPSTADGTMVADQLVEQQDGPPSVVPRVGRLRYVISPDHRHWHLLWFDRYELRPAGRRAAAVRDRKTGFCLGDRYASRTPPPGAPEEPVYTGNCGRGWPRLLGLTKGISVGWGDNYVANLEGQFLPIDGLPSGRYVLVHRANEHRRLRELDYRNNAASLLLRLRWRDGAPHVHVLRACPASARCDRARAR